MKHGDEINLELPEAELTEWLLPLLRGSVFHVTSSGAFEGISRDGCIRHNRDGRFPQTYPQSKKSFGRTRGYICLFDLRAITDTGLDDVLHKFFFLNPHFTGDRPVFLILNPSAHARLVPCEAARETGFNTMWIPNAECWYPEELPLRLVSRVIRVEVKRAPREPGEALRLTDLFLMARDRGDLE